MKLEKEKKIIIKCGTDVTITAAHRQMVNSENTY